MADVDTPEDHDTESIPGLVDAIRRGAGGLRDEAAKIVDRMRDAWEAERQRRMLRLAAVVAVGGYLLLRRKR